MMLLVLLSFVILQGGLGSRVHGAKASLTNSTPELYGVSNMVPDRHPRDEGSDSDAWTDVRAAILHRLGAVKAGREENFCWVSHEPVLNDQGHIVEGGLVVVAQKLATFRVNFYRMKEFRRWVHVKPLDIGSNKRFSDEDDVWVVRLTDGSEESRVPLPDLGIEASRNMRVVPSPERLARAEVVRSPNFARNLPVARTDQDTLIPSLVPQADETFAFELHTSQSTWMRRYRWDFFEVHLGLGIDDIAFNLSNATVLTARSSRLPRRRRWTIRDASDNPLFIVHTSADFTEHRLTTVFSGETLYVIRVAERTEPRETGLLQGARPLNINIFKGDGNQLVYSGETDDSPPSFICYFSGLHREIDRLVAVVPIGADGQRAMYVQQFTDAALLLIATAILFT
eukprot:TRINITY_DN16870_c0_g4_i1.p1 TRINITY_DN16870_c0_g4~~TRINITY_DN16870_c0_g4_i1.p1  ORF type:complete len:422 (+),score=44.56 TRINITY_DN16870_c0_g4_i1:73-1266(+)